MRSVHAILSELGQRSPDEVASPELNAMLELVVTLGKYAFAEGYAEGRKKGYQDAQREAGEGKRHGGEG